MALQDLTPQLRTRLSRMERAVGWFVVLATGLLLFGFGYYIFNIAERRGWFITKITYQTCVTSGAGLKVGDPVKLMGFDVGEITAIIPNDPYAYYNITVYFRVRAPNYGYIWSDSRVKVNAGDLLGGRFLEIGKGAAGVPTVRESSSGNKEVVGILKNKIVSTRQKELESQGKDPREVLAQLNQEATRNPDTYYTNAWRANIYFLEPLESPAVTERLDRLITQVESALPNILNLTNQISVVLSNTAALTANLSEVAAHARPAASNLALATAQLNQPGALGEWLLPTNLNQRLDSVLEGADTSLESLNSSLENLANLTSNLNYQVQINTNMLGGISKAVMDADDLVQGLKRHWLLRSAFKTKNTNAPSGGPGPVQSPKGRTGG
jgi:ABC-type transporter Mla subunit MlaD